jgi:hypothetical protein
MLTNVNTFSGHPHPSDSSLPLDSFGDQAVSEREPEAESTSAADPRHAEFERAYSALDAAHKWRLPCGTVVEDKLYDIYKFGKAGLVLSGDVEECILNFMVDLNSPDMQKLFSTIESGNSRFSGTSARCPLFVRRDFIDSICFGMYA